MNANAFWHLTWKEYRANRAFWLALVLLVGIVESVTAMLIPAASSPKLIYLAFSWALGAPAFFAVGSAGMAFAGEREEGTIDFLEAIPVTAKQIFASKLVVTTLATLALYAVVWPMAQWITRGALPEAKVLQELLAIWVVSAVEAIAWGTLFSLLSARPLLAIIEAIFFVSAIANVLVTHWHRVVLAQPYLAIAHWRILIALVVFALDIYLGLRWLDRERIRPRFPSLNRLKAPKPEETSEQNAAEIAKVHQMLARRHRGAMLGHLLWQEWRQSRRTLIGLATMCVVLALLVRWEMSRFWWGETAVVLLLVLLGITMSGCFTFRGDQSRRSYRFFAEHNVPPRYVWLTRHSVWLTAQIVTLIAVCIALVGPINFVRGIGELMTRLASGSGNRPPLEYLMLIPLVPLICYSAGQWASMMIRSALLAGTVGIGLSMLICCWLAIMIQLKVGLAWSVLPIPFVLLVATWLRAPDWILENTRFGARARAAAILLVPGATLLVAVPIYRVRQIPLVSPGFDPDASISAITGNSAVPINLYQEAMRAFVPAKPWNNPHWAAKNGKAIALALEASRQPGPVLSDPTVYDNPGVEGSSILTHLLLASGDELQAAGKLDDALDRYIAALRMACQTNLVCGPEGQNSRYGDEIFNRFSLWAVQKGQTAARIRSAIDQLNQITTGDLHLDARLEWWYFIARRRLREGDDWTFYEPQQTDQQNWKSEIASAQLLLPSERERAVRMLNILASRALARLQVITTSIARRGQAVQFVRPDWWGGWAPADYFTMDYTGPTAENPPAGVQPMIDWLETTAPRDLEQLGLRGMDAAKDLVWFETRRRATIIQLALVAYRIDHGSLPKSLDELVGPYLHELPADPYLGYPFRYFPNGMPAANLEWDRQSKKALAESRPAFYETLAQIKPGAAGIWSSGPDLIGDFSQANATIPQSVKYTFRELADYQTEYGTVWRRGLWFPIPEQKK